MDKKVMWSLVAIVVILLWWLLGNGFGMFSGVLNAPSLLWFLIFFVITAFITLFVNLFFKERLDNVYPKFLVVFVVSFLFGHIFRISGMLKFISDAFWSERSAVLSLTVIVVGLIISFMDFIIFIVIYIVWTKRQQKKIMK